MQSEVKINLILHATEDENKVLEKLEENFGIEQKDFQIESRVIKNEHSVTKLAIQNKKTNEWVIPFVIEPSAGVDRGVLAVLNEAYKIQKFDDGKERTLLALKPHLSPVKAAVIPLKKNNEELVKIASDLKSRLQKLNLGRIILENTGNIGKGYRRHDEIGTPLCITIDFDSLEDNTATVRDRDTMDQKRISIEKLPEYLTKIINGI